MPNANINALYTSGATLYAILVNSLNNQVYNTVSLAYEVYNSGHWAADYAVPLTELSGSGFYSAAYPIASPTILSTDVIYAQNGGSPALGDTPITYYRSQGQNIAAVGNIWQAGQNMGAALNTQQIGAISGTPASSTVMLTNLTSTAIDTYSGRALIMTSGLLIQQAAFILLFDGAGLLTINGFPSGATPAASDTFVIV